MASDDSQLLRTFRFQVQLFQSAAGVAGAPTERAPGAEPSGKQLGDGGFQECSGLDIEMDVQEYLEGGRNDGVIRRIGRGKYSPLVLKRGMLYAKNAVNIEFWAWIQDLTTGVRPARRYDGIVKVMTGTQDNVVVARWVFDRGLPQKVVGPQLNAKTGEVAIEELHIAHEGLRLVTS